MRARSGSSMLLSLLTQASLKVSTIKSKSLKEMPMGLEIYLISSLISNTFQFPKSFLEPTEKYEEPKVYNWESAEVIIDVNADIEGPNVIVVRIATNNVRTVRSRKCIKKERT